MEIESNQGWDISFGPRDPEDRTVSQGKDHERELREKALDKTLADTFPTSDPPSSIPDPGVADPYAA